MTMGETIAGQRDVIVRVALPVPLFKEFDYQLIDPDFEPCAGCRVRVSFGSRQLIGICTEVGPTQPFADPKPVLEWLDVAPLVPTHVLALARWLAGYYHHPLGAVLATCLPVGARTGRSMTLRKNRVWQVSHTPLTPDALHECRTQLARAPRQLALFNLLAATGPQSRHALKDAGFSLDQLRSLADREFIAEVEAGRCYSVKSEYLHLIQPTPEQQSAIESVRLSLGTFQPWLLEGVTGSGKTEVYLRLIEHVISQGKQALLLVPEISLTPQTIARVRARFPDCASFHSGLTDNERWDAYLDCKDGSASVLVGTRSSIFAQFPNLGLIIVDEEHDASFKQQDGLRYSARDVAVWRAQALGIPVVLGSATPSLESVDNVRKGRYRHLELITRPSAASPASFHVLDIRGKPLDEGLSHDMLRVMERHLSSGGQVLTYINRRGFSPVLLCASCGWVAACPHCDSRMTLHRQPAILRCHHCGFHTAVPLQCDNGHANLLPIGFGTQRTEAALERIFPRYPVLRIDRDTTRNSQQLEEHLERVQAGQPMILVGTQMLAKGHHFPDVSLVAIINADAGFLSADFRAPERTAQTIMQVAGRAGRASRSGEIWIQTLQPEHPSLQRLVCDGYAAFARHELENRESAGLPPAAAMALIRADATTVTEASAFLENLRLRLDRRVSVSGPVPAPIQRIANRHRLQLLLLAANRSALQRSCAAIRALPETRTLRWSIDIDPYDGA
jgi:primosomal protein N' (replication factor Y) (superfamily II helicase)